MNQQEGKKTSLLLGLQPKMFSPIQIQTGTAALVCISKEYLHIQALPSLPLPPSLPPFVISLLVH